MYRTLLILVILFSLFDIEKVYSEINKTKVVILDLKSFGIKRELADAIIDSLRNEFIRSEKFIVANRKNLDSILTTENFIEIGKLIGAEKIITGSVGKLGEVYSLTLKMINVQTGENEEILNYREKCSAQDLFYLIKKYYIQLNGNDRNKISSHTFSSIKKQEEKPKIEDIPGLIKNSTRIIEEDKFTNNYTNLFLRSIKEIQPYDIIEITHELILYQPFFNFSDTFHDDKIKQVGVRPVDDRFFNPYSACELYSNDSFIEFNLNDSIDVVKELSIVIYIKFNNLPNNGYASIISKQDKENNTFSLYLDSKGSLYFSSSVKGIDRILSSDNCKLNTNKWYHIVAIIDRFEGKMYLYIDNKKISEENILQEESDKNNFPIVIGKNNKLNKIQAVVDDVRIYSRALSNSEVHCLFYENNWKSKALVMYLPFNSMSYEVTRAHSGEITTGWVHNVTLTKDRFGKKDRAYSFKGKDSNICYPELKHIDIYYKFSVLFWLNISPKNDIEATLIHKYYEKNKNGFDIYLTKQKDGSYKINLLYNGQNVQSNKSMPFNKWHNIAITYDNGKVEIFVNGQSDSVILLTNSFAQNNLPLILGNTGEIKGNNPFIGIMDDIRIYYRALSKDEIKIFFNENNWDK